MTRSLALVPLPFTALVAALGIMLAHAPAAFSVDRAQPLIVATNWGSFGGWLVAIAVVMLGIGALIATRVIGRVQCVTPERARAALLGVVTACAISCIVTLCAPLVFSSDVYAYAAYGEMTRLGLDPYAPTVLARGNALLDAAIWQWQNPMPVCVYGPAFVELATTTIGLLGSHGIFAQLLGLRVEAVLALLVCVPLAYAAYPGAAGARLGAAATIGLNPVLIWCAAEGHNDTIALAAVLAGAALLRRGATGGGILVAGLGGLVKLPALVAALGLALVQTRRRTIAAVAAFLTLAIVAAGYLPLARRLLTAGHQHGGYVAFASLQGALAPLLGAGVAVAAAVLAAAALIWRGVVLLHRGERSGWIVLGIGAWALIPNPYPWYGCWLIALAALVPDEAAAGTAALLVLAGLLRYLPDAAGPPGTLAAVLIGALAATPLLRTLRRSLL